MRRRQAQALLHDRNRHEKGGGDFFLGLALFAQGEERPKLVERVKWRALDVLGETVLLGDAAFAHDAGYGRGLRHALLLHEELERAVAATAGRDLEHSGLIALGVANRPNREALQQRAPRNVLGEFLNRDAGLDPPDVRSAEEKLVERDVP